MGITSSTENSDLNSRNEKTLLEKLEDLKVEDPRDLPEKVKVQVQATADAAAELVWRELHALFPPTLGESSTEQPKEGDTERDEDEEVVVRFRDFMKGGCCKESFTPLEDCVREASVIKCKEHIPMLKKCMVSHSDYYQPILALAETAEKQVIKEALATGSKLRGD